ncbi:PAS domain-containing protein [Gracilimonas mengyeensis]|uniref:Aerotaxis receptor n=1 Tax=Gracilimonas mengyeensis TaxID=1302730 RepID=A0A521FLQ4_9BACT|nr:PAS domain-containing protein [Gracilimonas mengyeensis]SMO97153.1 aerotaxis receptor [Gracilimonas mengyeensis]
MEATKKIKDFTIPKPLNKERPFEYHELFFSITDPKSVITYANDVFIRISAYPEEELIGVLHKIIRHPDVPRAVFRIFWDFLEAGKPVAAYVKNLAKDGCYYWVMALAFPCEGGYLSIRLKPGTKLFKTVEKLYKEALEVEKSAEQHTDKKTAMMQAVDFINKKINELGFDSYESFMWHALEQEMANRQDHLSGTNDITHKNVESVPFQMRDLEHLLSGLFNHLGRVRGLQTNLAENSGFINTLSSSIALLSLNAQIGSSKINQQDISLSVVAKNMGDQAVKGKSILTNMKSNIKQLDKLLSAMAFDVISSKLMVEMTNTYLKGLGEERTDSTHVTELSPHEVISILKNAFSPYLNSTSRHLAKLPHHIHKLSSNIHEVEKLLKMLRFTHNTGKIEISRIRENSHTFTTTFKELLQEIDAAQEVVSTLSDFINESRSYHRFYYQNNTNLKSITDRLEMNALITA